MSEVPLHTGHGQDQSPPKSHSLNSPTLASDVVFPNKWYNGKDLDKQLLGNVNGKYALMGAVGLRSSLPLQGQLADKNPPPRLPGKSHY